MSETTNEAGTPPEMTRHDQVLLGLIFSLQAGAMQQMGKIQNPMTGEIEKDLQAARSSIDVLEMLKAKCRTDTPEDILRMLDSAVMDLQLNYMDELKKEKKAEAAGSESAEDGNEEEKEEKEEEEKKEESPEADA